MAKFMWMAGSGICGNRPCLAGCKIIGVLQNWLEVSIEPFHWVAVFNWPCTDEHPTNILKLMTQHKWYLYVQTAPREIFEPSQFD